MCSALSPDRYPRPPPASLCLPRIAAEPAPGTRPWSDCPRGAGAGGGAGVPPAESRLTSPPFYHSRTRFLNLIPNVPAPKFWTLEAKTVNAAGIGRLRLFEGGDKGASSEFLLAAVLSLGSPAQSSPPP
ncbi:hypothetical protein mRhiFer1_008846 [Rhinolophus ferrumequinum]|uniref:Uncharacterized protein n=1 Tax=Rhinolophus ferrumequinum TaxID=59479 RepID=A0A7J8AEG5_RHIFE|nr:hypothetical protein mRhiFer1_008846 [Rhinolophus ferrumequinum]